MTNEPQVYSSPTVETYISLDEAFARLDEQLFDQELRGTLLITLQRRGKVEAYFSRDKFIGRGENGKTLHEIALNPAAFRNRDDEHILALLAHNMVHVNQLLADTAGSDGYHNLDWADRMEAIGLIPTSNGEIGGPRTGERVGHVIKKGDRFDMVCRALLADGRRILRYEDRHDEQTERKRAERAASHTLFTCSKCFQKVRGARKTFVRCGICNIRMQGAVGQIEPE